MLYYITTTSDTVVNEPQRAGKYFLMKSERQLFSLSLCHSFHSRISTDVGVCVCFPICCLRPTLNGGAVECNLLAMMNDNREIKERWVQNQNKPKRLWQVQRRANITNFKKKERKTNTMWRHVYPLITPPTPIFAEHCFSFKKKKELYRNEKCSWSSISCPGKATWHVNGRYR